MELATGAHAIRLNCACGADYTYPDVRDTGIAPDIGAAERSRNKAFRAAGVVKNIGGFALGISLLGILFFPLGLVGAAVGVYCVTMLRGAVGRYSGRRWGWVAIFLGVAVFGGEGVLALNYLKARRESRIRSLQETATEDLKRLRRAERLHRATHDTYADFGKFRFQVAHGRYTLYLGPTSLIEAERDGAKVTDPLPDGYPAAVGRDDFTAFAVANLDGDESLDVWVMTARGGPTHVVDDLERSVGMPTGAELPMPDSGVPEAAPAPEPSAIEPGGSLGGDGAAAPTDAPAE